MWRHSLLRLLGLLSRFLLLDLLARRQGPPVQAVRRLRLDARLLLRLRASASGIVDGSIVETLELLEADTSDGGASLHVRPWFLHAGTISRRAEVCEARQT